MLKRLLPLLATLALAGAAFAQGKIDTFDAHCADITILQSKAVQKEVGISEAVRKKLNDQATWHQRQLQALDSEIRTTKKDPRSAEIQGKIANLFATLKSRVLSNLSPAQVKRLGELSLQRVGDAALTDPIVAKKVGLSDAQLKKMQTTYSEGAQKFVKLEQETAQKVLLPYKDRKPKDEAEAKRLDQEIQTKLAAAGKQIQPKMEALRATYRKRIRAILTSTQTATYNKLRGKPFRGS
jgi:hypothetical protein